MSKGEYIRQSVISSIGKHSNIGQSMQIKSGAITMTIAKTENITTNQSIYEGLGKSNVPSLCNLISNNDPNACQSYNNATMTVQS